MPPKCRFTRRQVVDAALDITRTQGFAALTARTLAARLGCSVKPIFSLFENMEAVQRSVLESAQAYYEQFTQDAMNRGDQPLYKASGMAYIRFAREETELFHLLFLRDRHGEIPESRESFIDPILALIQENLGISREAALQYHLEMWVYVHGIATMIATGYLSWDSDFISRALTDSFIGLNYRYTQLYKGAEKEAADRED